MAPLNLKGIFLPALMYALLRSRTTPVQETPPEDEYDFIVVGSGWGGSVVANRLTEDPGTRVLLLEAGAKDNVSSEIPLLSIALHGGEYDWKYTSTPQEKACFAMKDKRCNIQAGKVEGGSSVLDILFYSDSPKMKFDQIAETLPDWSAETFNKYFMKHQDYHKNDEDKCPDDGVHGCGGPVYVGGFSPLAKGDTTDFFIESAKEVLGVEVEENIFNKIGVSENALLIKKGAKVGASTSYLKPVSKTRKNLHISLNSFVLKILIDPTSKRATGVEYEKDGVVKQVKAKKEVILSAGTYNSPKLLMLSGVGPKEQLDKYSIPVIADVPGVGENYKDYVSTTVLFTTGKKMDDEKLNLVDTTTIRTWAKGIGKMTTPAGLDASASYSTANTDVPDVLFMYQSLELFQIFSPFLQKSMGFTDKYWDQLIGPLIDIQIANIQPVIDVKSVGTVKLSSSNPKDSPIIDPNFYGDDRDVEAMIKAFRVAQKFVEAKPYKDNGYTLSPHTFDECEKFTDRTSEDYIRCHLKYATLVRYCGQGTCKMGPASDEKAVVDERLRVRGISGLRVVDASILPISMASPISALVIAVAEKGADMIKEDNK